jgi:hypothetical protein
VFVHLAIHRPRPEKAQFLIDSMHRFRQTVVQQPGIIQVHALKDQNSGALIGLAIWDKKESMLAARPAKAEAVKDDPFEEWENKPPEVFHLEMV